MKTYLVVLKVGHSFAKDGLILWDAVLEWMTNYECHCYADERAMKNDPYWKVQHGEGGLYDASSLPFKISQGQGVPYSVSSKLGVIVIELTN
ncbi:hypothetical protein SDJN03_29288, partial [Cucurbita argyrosperma subsp. sororia]